MDITLDLVASKLPLFYVYAIIVPYDGLFSKESFVQYTIKECSIGEVHEVRVQPLLVRRSVTDFPSLDRLPEDENRLTPDNPCASSSPYNLGQAHFIVNYDQHRTVLMVRLVKALNLSPFEKEWSKPCNPYVIVQLLPDYRHQLQSTVHKKTTNPRFDETFEFELSYKELQLQTLWLTFLSFDSSSRHDVIGQVVLPLADLSLSQDNVFRTDRNILAKVNVAKRSSEIHFQHFL
ncbi:hypothetical protein OS493_008032 [Desmophyllum pertusum]|uniref:C2 domain-containing protein n=1 Tax=Desmophyllum pertusum TaxID=174260 RepID=A0A9W9YIB7_9CNID|nr:hypothetical protein OS493_008032 [Desmophyllum pertusum]